MIFGSLLIKADIAVLTYEDKAVSFAEETATVSITLHECTKLEVISLYQQFRGDVANDDSK